MTRTAEHKVPGGKLIRADVAATDTIDAVELHGDFFIYPEDAVYTIQDALTGATVDADEAELADRVRNAVTGAELVGFEPVHVAQVVRNALDQEGDVDE